MAAPRGPVVTLPPHLTFGRDGKASRLIPALGWPGHVYSCILHCDGSAISELGSTVAVLLFASPHALFFICFPPT